MDIQLKTGCFDDAALVRRVVFMDEQGYENEFDAIDEDPNCIHVTLYVDGELAGCSRVFPEELERAADAEAPVSPACDLDEGVAAGRPTLWGAWPCCRTCAVAVWRARLSRPVMRVHAMPALFIVACAGIRAATLCQGGLHANCPGRLRRRGPAPCLDGQARRWQIGTLLFCRQLGTLLGNWRIGALGHTVFRYRVYICALMGYKI